MSIYMQKEGSKKDKLALPIIERFLKKNNIRYHISTPNEKKNMIIINIKCKALSNYMLNVLNVYVDKVKNIDIEKLISENNYENLKSFYYGLLYSEGSIDEEDVTPRYTFDNKSNILTTVFNLLSFFIEKKPTSRTLDKRYGAVKTRTLRKFFEVSGCEKYIYTKIQKITKTDKYVGEVYDLTIENDPSFMVENCIVHNSCSSFITNFFLGLTNVDRIKASVTMLPTRFLSADRIIAGSLPDID